MLVVPVWSRPSRGQAPTSRVFGVDARPNSFQEWGQILGRRGPEHLCVRIEERTLLQHARIVAGDVDAGASESFLHAQSSFTAFAFVAFVAFIALEMAASVRALIT